MAERTERFQVPLVLEGSLAALGLGAVYSNGWLIALGALVFIPISAVIILAAALTGWSRRATYAHPELYETIFEEDSAGNITGITWRPLSKAEAPVLRFTTAPTDSGGESHG